MPQFSPQKKHSQRNVVAIAIRILNGLLDFARQFRSQRLVGIYQKDPVISERKRLQRPLALLGPSSLIVELDHVRTARLCDLHSPVRALGIDNINLSGVAQRFQAPRQVAGLIACGDNHGDGK